MHMIMNFALKKSTWLVFRTIIKFIFYIAKSIRKVRCKLYMCLECYLRYSSSLITILPYSFKCYTVFIFKTLGRGHLTKNHTGFANKSSHLLA